MYNGRYQSGFGDPCVIFAYLDLLEISVAAFLVFFGAVVASLLIGIAVHEFSHAFTADALGDPTPRAMGRVSLNPAVHLDPAGTALLVLGGFGWGKPVQISPWHLENPKTGSAIIAAAGPLSNLLLALVFAVPIRAGLIPLRTPFDIGGFLDWTTDDYVGLFFTSLVLFNLILFVFNLIPIAPLDGFNVAVGILPGELSRTLARTAPWGPGLLFLLIALPFLTGVSLIGKVMFPVVESLADALVGT
jgi:Zn-dependent protease